MTTTTSGTYAALAQRLYGGVEHRVIEPDCSLADLVDDVLALVDTQKSHHFLLTGSAARQRTEALRDRFNWHDTSFRVHCLTTRCEATAEPAVEQYCCSVVLVRLPRTLSDPRH